METTQPVLHEIKTGKASRLEHEYVLDGISALGTSWDIVSISTIGNTRIHVNLAHVTTSSKYKGFVDLQRFDEILRIKLTDVSGLDVILLLCSETKRKNWLNSDLAAVRKLIVKAIGKSINRLDDASMTKRDYAFRIDDECSVHNQQDWECVGTYLAEEICKIHEQIEVNGERYDQIDFWRNVEVYFQAENYGQEKVIKPWELPGSRLHFDERYSCLQPKNILRLVVHCANDFRTNSEVSKNFIVVPNSEYISSRLERKPKENRDYYCPFLCIPGLGNLRYTFPERTQGRIFGCQIYQRWTNYTKNHPYHAFQKTYIANRLSAIMKNRFDFYIKERKETHTKVRFEKDKALLSNSNFYLIKDMLGVLEAGVEVRVEVVHSSSEISEGTIGGLIVAAFKETRTWLDEKGLGLLDREMFTYLSKTCVMAWAKHYITPSMKTLERIVGMVKQAAQSESVIDIKHKSFWTLQDYKDVVAAETLISFFLNGRLQYDKEQPLPPSEMLSTFGFNIENRRGNFVLRNLKIDNGYIHCTSELLAARVPEWIIEPEVCFLKRVLESMEKMLEASLLSKSITSLHSDETLLCVSLLGFAMAFRKRVYMDNKLSLQRNSNIEFVEDNSHTLDLKTMLASSTIAQFKSSSRGKQNRVEIKRKVVPLPNLVEVLLEGAAFGKPEVSFVLNSVDSCLRKKIPDWNLSSALVSFLHGELLRQQLPIVFDLTGGSFIAGMPYDNQLYEPDMYMPLVKNTYLWYTGETIAGSHIWTDKEKKYFERLVRIVCYLCTNNCTFRSKLELNKLMELSVLIIGGKVYEARDLVKEIQIIFGETEKSCLKFIFKLFELL